MPAEDTRNDALVEWALAHDGETAVSRAGDSDLDERLAPRVEKYKRFRRLLEVDETPADRPSADPTPGTVNGRYESLELIGKGGGGAVYKAWDAVLDQHVALKFLRADGTVTPEARDRFLREARILARLRHPHIVTIHDYGTDAADGRAYLRLNWVSGGSLAARRGEFVGHPEKAARLVEQVARAIQHAHAHDICHRDLKPGNILLDEGGNACVADFGIAKLVQAVGGSPAALTDTRPKAGRNTTDGLGTPPYMAPEQFREGFGPVGSAADVWALGVVLYELLTGRRPFAGRTYLECEEAVCTRTLVRPRALDRRISRDLEAVCLRCLARRPQDRWASAGAVADAIRGARERDTRFRRFRRPVQFVAAGLAVAAVGSGVWAVTRDRGSEGIERVLRDTGRVTLVPHSGLPGFFKPVTPYGVKLPPADHTDGPFVVQFEDESEYGLVELIEHNPRSAFRLDAELVVSPAGPEAEAGLYVHRRVIDGTHHYLVAGVLVTPTSLELTLTAHARVLAAPGQPIRQYELKKRDLRLPADWAPGRFVPFSLDVRPDRIVAAVAGQELAVNLADQGPPGVAPAGGGFHVSPPGGVGLVGRGCVVTARNVILNATDPNPGE